MRANRLCAAGAPRSRSTGCASAAPMQVNEALECLGGNGFVEECVLPRLYREAPLNSIWEGSGNVICLDILRAMNKEPDAVESVRDEIRSARGGDRRFDAFTATLEKDLALRPRKWRHGVWRSESRWRSKRRFLSATASLKLPMPFAHRGWRTKAAVHLVRCPKPQTSKRLSTGRFERWRTRPRVPRSQSCERLVFRRVFVWAKAIQRYENFDTDPTLIGSAGGSACATLLDEQFVDRVEQASALDQVFSTLRTLHRGVRALH